MNWMIKYWIIALALIVSLQMLAQDVSFTVDAPSKVEHGGQFRITYTTNHEGEFSGPSFTDFQLLGGPNIGSSTSMQIINGRTSSTSSKSYTYYLSANKIGKFSLPIATLVVDGKEYKSVPLSIEVVKSASPQNGQGSSMEITNPEFKPDGNVFVRAFVDKKNIYVGEPILLTQKLYSKENIANLTDLKEPAYTGFWKESIDIGELKLTKEVLNGQNYNVVLLQKAILFPQKSGNLEIGSITLDAIVQIIKKRKAKDRFEQMMYGNILQYYDNQEVHLKSPVLKIKVNELPNNKPQNFNGAVGDFKLEATIDKTDLQTNDAMNLKIKISGTGNIDLLEKPNIDFPPDFEVYDPKVNKTSQNTANGVSGSTTYEFLIIPRNEGDFKIPAISYSYFNPQTERYENCVSPEFLIHVTRGEGDPNISAAMSNAVNRDEIKYIGQDIRYILFKSDDLQEIGSHSFNSWQHLLSLILAPFLTLGIILLYKKSEKKRGNSSLMRLKRATKMAKMKLKTARKYLEEENQDKFYEETTKALWGYIGDKFNLGLSEISMDKAQEIFVSNNIDNQMFDEFKSIIENCEFARYAPTQGQKEMQSIYDGAAILISKIEKSLR